MVFSFLQRRCHPLTRCIKKIADQHCYNVKFYMRRTEHKYYNNNEITITKLHRNSNIPEVTKSSTDKPNSNVDS